MRRRLAILLVPAVATVGATVGSVMSAAPAHADDIVTATVTVNPPIQKHLLSLCIGNETQGPGDPETTPGPCLVI